MKLEFTQNEFTVTELLEYFESVYKSQINCNPFSLSLLHQWIRLRKIPELYGGNKITKVERFSQLRNFIVLTIENLTRDHVMFFVSSCNRQEKIQNKRMNPNALLKKKRKPLLRTEYYFEILARSNKNYSTALNSRTAIPNHWKKLGIKKNQF